MLQASADVVLAATWPRARKAASGKHRRLLCWNGSGNASVFCRRHRGGYLILSVSLSLPFLLSASVCPSACPAWTPLGYGFFRQIYGARLYKDSLYNLLYPVLSGGHSLCCEGAVALMHRSSSLSLFTTLAFIHFTLTSVTLA